MHWFFIKNDLRCSPSHSALINTSLAPYQTLQPQLAYFLNSKLCSQSTGCPGECSWSWEGRSCISAWGQAINVLDVAGWRCLQVCFIFRDWPWACSICYWNMDVEISTQIVDLQSSSFQLISFWTTDFGFVVWHL